MMADRYRGAIYIGVTAQIAQRGFQHRSKEGSAFCRRYGIERLVYADWTERIVDAIAREKAMKKWRRSWKIELIERGDPAVSFFNEGRSEVPAFAGMTDSGGDDGWVSRDGRRCDGG